MKNLIIRAKDHKDALLPMSKEHIKELIHRHVWVQANGECVAVHKMKAQHIENTINCLSGKGHSYISDSFLEKKTQMTRGEWICVLEEELTRRQ